MPRKRKSRLTSRKGRSAMGVVTKNKQVKFSDTANEAVRDSEQNVQMAILHENASTSSTADTTARPLANDEYTVTAESIDVIVKPSAIKTVTTQPADGGPSTSKADLEQESASISWTANTTTRPSVDVFTVTTECVDVAMEPSAVKITTQPIDKPSTSKVDFSIITDILDDSVKHQSNIRGRSSVSTSISSKKEPIPDAAKVLFPIVEHIHPIIYSDSDSSEEDVKSKKPRYHHDHRKSKEIIEEQKSSINFFGGNCRKNKKAVFHFIVE